MKFDMKPPEIVTYDTNKIALIDADYIKYIVTYRMNQNRMFNKDESTPSDIIIEETDNFLSEILVGINCKERVFIFSGKTKDGFRWLLARDKPYKGSRKAREPLYPNQLEDMNFIYQYIANNNHSILYPDLEADDILCFLQSEDTFIYSKDKDMMQIPGTHYDIKTEDFIVITEGEAWRFLMTQALIGDSTDNILGLRNFGPAKAKKLLDGEHTSKLHLLAIDEYMEHLGRRAGLDAFVENYSLVRLTLNRGDYLREKCKDAFNLINTLKLVK